MTAKKKLYWETADLQSVGDDSETNFKISAHDEKFVLYVDNEWAGLYTTIEKAKKVNN